MLEVRRNAAVLRRWWWLLILAAIVGGIAAYGLTKLLVKQEYQGTAIISMAPPPQSQSGLLITMLSAAADAQLVPTQATATVAARGLPGVPPTKLVDDIQSTASPEGQLLYVRVQWTSVPVAQQLTTAVAQTFIQQERARLRRRYAIIHQGFVAEEQHQASLIRSLQGNNDATNWLRSQYADSAARIYQEDADASVEAATQEASLQLVQPATKVIAVGPRAPLNGALGAVVALLVALVFAFASTAYYGETDEERLRPVLAKVSD